MRALFPVVRSPRSEGRPEGCRVHVLRHGETRPFGREGTALQWRRGILEFPQSLALSRVPEQGVTLEGLPRGRNHLEGPRRAWPYRVQLQFVSVAPVRDRPGLAKSLSASGTRGCQDVEKTHVQATLQDMAREGSGTVIPEGPPLNVPSTLRSHGGEVLSWASNARDWPSKPGVGRDLNHAGASAVRRCRKSG